MPRSAQTNGYTIFDLEARTATENSDGRNTFGARGLRLSLFVSAAAGTSPTLDVKVQGCHVDSAGTERWYDLHGAAFAQVSAATANPVYLAIAPGVAETANQTVSDLVPHRYRVVATIGGTSPSFTFAVRAEEIH